MSADQKSKFGNILEIPYLSKFHRHLLDGFKVHKLSQKIKGLQMKSILDVCCGLGEYSTLGIAQYIGVDNSPNSIDFAQKKYSRH
jgi:SAM-dependent methyltransferase